MSEFLRDNESVLESFLEELARLDAQAADASAAESILGGLSRAMFPGAEAPSADRVTWPESERADQNEQSAEERLRRAEARYRTLVEQIPAVTFMAALGDGDNEVYINPHITDLLGFSQEEWLDNPFLWFDQLHPDDRQLWIEEFMTGVQRGGPFKAECRFLARDGSVVWVRGEARIVKDELGRPQFLQGVAFDMTETKRAQEVLLENAIKEARHAEEVAIAHRVQTSLLPKRFAFEHLELTATMEPASSVGGDYYDVRPCEDGAWIGVGDVSGHGVDAGLIMLMLQSGLAALFESGERSPATILARLNAILYSNIRDRMASDDHVTLCLLRVRDDGSVVFAGAHEDIVVLRRGAAKAERVHTPGPWVGAVPDVEEAAVDSALQLGDGDTVVMFTDGVTEARDADGRLFDIHRLCEAVERRAGEPVEAIQSGILADVHAWMDRQEDDISLLIFRYRSR